MYIMLAIAVRYNLLLLTEGGFHILPVICCICLNTHSVLNLKHQETQYESEVM